MKHIIHAIACIQLLALGFIGGAAFAFTAYPVHKWWRGDLWVSDMVVFVAGMILAIVVFGRSCGKCGKKVEAT